MLLVTIPLGLYIFISLIFPASGTCTPAGCWD